MKFVKLTDICNPKQWKTISTADFIEDGLYDVYGANGVIGKTNEFNHEVSTLLLTCRGATCGALNITNGRCYVNGNAMCMDDLVEDFNLKFIYYYLKYYDMSKIISGTAQPQITIASLNKVLIPSISYEEQLKIVNELEKIENSITVNRQQMSNFDEIVKSQFIEMFDKYNKTELSIIAKIIMGQSPDSKSYNDNCEGVPFFQGKADYGEKYTIVKHWTTNPTKMAKANSVLMSVRAPVGPVNIANVDCCIGRGLCSIDYIIGKTNNEFLYNALKVMESDIALMGSGSTFKAINKNDIFNLMIPNAPLDLQNEFSLFAQQIDKSKYFGGVSYAIC